MFPTNHDASSASDAPSVPHRKPVPHDLQVLSSSSSFGDDVGYHSAPTSLYSLNGASSTTVNTTASGYTPSSTSSNSTVTQHATAGPSVQQLSLANLQGIVGEDADEHYRDQDFDSAYDSESLIGGDTMTLASYITDYRFEHGRRYHAYRDGAYWVSSRLVARHPNYSAASALMAQTQGLHPDLDSFTTRNLFFKEN